jgi:biopolymer transport protein ExbD
MHIARRERRTGQMPLTALIDVVFQLLLFFMLSTSFVRQESIELALPSAKAKPKLEQVQKPRLMRVKVESGGRMALDGMPVDGTALRTQLENIFNHSPESGVIIVVGDDLNLQEMVSVMDIIYASGGKNVGVANHIQKAPIMLNPAANGGR